MKLIFLLTLLSCYVHGEMVNTRLTLIGTTVFSSVENQQIRQCTIEYIQNNKNKDGIGSYVKNCTRNEPTPPSEGKAGPNGIAIVGSTAFPYDDVRKCLNLLPHNVRNPGSETKLCLNAPITTPSPGNHSVTGGHAIERNEGEDAVFTCIVAGMRTNDTFSWIGPVPGRRRAEVLYMYQRGNVVSPTQSRRLSFSYENTSRWMLKIKQIQRTDAGEYQCEVKTTNSAGMLHIENASYHLSVKYKVSINGILPNRFPHVLGGDESILYFNETDNVTLFCVSDGIPEPQTFWRKGEGELLPSGEDISLGNNYTIYNISTDDGGIYWCESRQSLIAVARNVTIVVQHRPITTVTEPVIRSKEGKSVILDCQFDSDPLQATAVWYRKGKVLSDAEPTLRYSSRYFIDSLDPQKHYGNYTCEVTNLLGSSQCNFEITGRPAKPIITSPRLSSKMRVYTLEWTFEVYDISSIECFLVYFARKAVYKGIRNEMLRVPPIKPVPVDPKRPMHFKRSIHDLWPNSTYCLELFAENKYGQGDAAYFEFRTAEKDAPMQKPTREPPPTPAGQYNGGERPITASVYISLGTAVLIAGILRS